MNVQDFTFSLISLNRRNGYAIGVLLTALVSVAPAVIPLHTPTPLQAAAPPTTTAAKADSVTLPPAGHQEILSRYGQVPLHFEPNRGQTAADVQFLARGPGYALFLTPQEVVWTMRSPSTAQVERNSPSVAAESTEAVVRMGFVGATDSPPLLTGLDPQPGRSSYFIGSDPQHWHTAVPHYSKVQYKQVYPGIDLVLYGNPQQLEYDFVVAPGSDPAQIRLAFRNIEALRVDDRGQLVLQVPGGELVHQAPQVYQIIDGERRPIAGRYVLQEPAEADATHALPTVGFQVAAYDSKVPLVIDPSLLYSTYLGGSDEDIGYGIAIDTSGNAYVVGDTYSADFPVAFPYQRNYGGGSSTDVFITKLDATGQNVVYSTYLGGRTSDHGYGIAVDAAGYVYLTGYTIGDFPILNAFQPNYSGRGDVFVTKLDTTGQALIYSTYLGGSDNDVSYGIAVDITGHAYVTGYTESSNFPTANPFQSGRRGERDVFVTKLDATGRTLVYSTYLGGGYGDEGRSIAVDAAGYAYVTGYTESADFPSTAYSFQPNKGGGDYDAFVTKLATTGQNLIYSTYLGGNGRDKGYGIAVDAFSQAYVTGSTVSTNFPIASPPQHYPFQSYKQGGTTFSDAFVTKLDALGQTLVYSTYLGSDSGDVGHSIAVDAAGYVYVTGETSGSNFPIANAFQQSYGGGVDDVFVTQLDDVGQTLIYSTYLGGSKNDIGYGIAVDESGVYITGTTTSLNFPTANPWQRTKAGGSVVGSDDDAFVTKFPAVRLFFLTVTGVGTGTGTIISDPAGINCGSDCNQSYVSGTGVTLMATPASGSRFAGWSGACTGTGACQVTMDRARTVTATFTLSCPNDRDCDGIPDAVEVTQGTNPDLKDNDVFTNSRLFVMQQYRDFLHREGDPGGVNYWQQQLADGALERATIADLFLTSPEFEGQVAPLVRLYMAYFLRLPDYRGLWYWVGQLSNGMPLPAISQAFANSAEFQQRYGALDCNAFVTLVYQNVLGRNPEPGGLAYWQGQLCTGTMTRGEVMLAFAQSPEYQQRVHDPVLAVMLYVGLLQREPEQAGFDYWVGQLQAGMTRRDVISAFMNSPEYHQRFLP